MSPLLSPHFLLISEIETDLRSLLPAKLYTDLYIESWADQIADTEIDTEKEDGKKLKPIFDHLVSLQKILSDYNSTLITEKRASKDELHLIKRTGALMFTDLAGFTKLMEANTQSGKEGAKNLLRILNQYFTDMFEIISSSGGELLEFAGDALLIWFPDLTLKITTEGFLENKLNKAISKAVRAGLRMQRVMEKYKSITTSNGLIELRMRIGIHAGHFYSTDIGTPRRRDHILLGGNVQKAKLTESYGENGLVNISPETYQHIREDFRFKKNINKQAPGYMLVIDDLQDKLGDYEVLANPNTRRLASTVLEDKKFSVIYDQIKRLLESIKHLASFIPSPVLNILLENVSTREIPPDFPSPTMVFLNLPGLPNLADHVTPNEEHSFIQGLSVVFSRINAIVESQGGLLKKMACHTSGSYMIICFGVPASYTDNSIRAAKAALEIRRYLSTAQTLSPIKSMQNFHITCQIGITSGLIFAAEVGGKRGRREFNFHSDIVNTAARLMDYANTDAILLSQSVYDAISSDYECITLGETSLKGKNPIMVYELVKKKSSDLTV